MRLERHFNHVRDPSELGYEQQRQIARAAERHDAVEKWLIRLLLGAHAGGIAGSLSLLQTAISADAYNSWFAVPLFIFAIGVCAIGLYAFLTLSSATHELMQSWPGFGDAVQSAMPTWLKTNPDRRVEDAMQRVNPLRDLFLVASGVAFFLGIVVGLVTLVIAF